MSSALSIDTSRTSRPSAPPAVHVSGRSAEVAALVARLLNEGWTFPELPRRVAHRDWLVRALPPRTVTLQLPAAGRVSAAGAGPLDASGQPGGQTPPILLVEDDPVMLVVATCSLQGLGHEVVAETTVAGALRRLEEPGAVHARLVLDHDLPDGTGREIAVLASVLHPGTPVVMHTSRQLECAPAGVHHVVRKAPGLIPLLDVLSAA